LGKKRKNRKTFFRKHLLLKYTLKTFIFRKLPGALPLKHLAVYIATTLRDWKPTAFTARPARTNRIGAFFFPTYKNFCIRHCTEAVFQNFECEAL